MTKKKKTGHIKQTKHKKSAGCGRQTSQRKPVNQGKQTSQAKPASQKKASEQAKLASQKKASEQAKPASQTKQAKQTSQKNLADQANMASQTKQTGQKNPASQTKQTNQRNPASQTKQINQRNPADQTSQTKQDSKSNTRQEKQTGQVQQVRSGVKQRNRNAQRRKNHTDQKRNGIRHRGQWKEVLYNCPYVLGIVLTSLLVMLWSDEIGFKAAVREVQAVMAQTGRTGEHVSDPLLYADKTLSGEAYGNEDNNTDILEKNFEDDGQQEENAGIRKEQTNGKETENNLNNNMESTDNAENIGETEDIPKGITRFIEYEPQEIDSRYYSDAGKVALTTEYPYAKENNCYFSDAAFLGDSRTLGISDYAGLEEADFYCDSGMMIFKLLEEEITYQKTGDKVDLTQVLQEKQYGKIYIMLGMNELGYGNTETYLEQYRKVVDQIREWQPQAIIYVMANLHVSREKNNMETEFNNININDKNAASAQLANGTDIFYLDANPLFTDRDGFLNAELTFDGVHLYAQHYDVWREFLLEHAVEPLQDQKDAMPRGA